MAKSFASRRARGSVYRRGHAAVRPAPLKEPSALVDALASASAWALGDGDNRVLLDAIRAEKGRAYVVGGFVRDVFIEEMRSMPLRPPKDLDLVVDIDPAVLERLIAEHTVPGRSLRTSLGGYHWYGPSSRLPIDVWALPETYWIKRFRLEPTLANFLRGSAFNIDRAAYDLDSTELHVLGATQAIRDEIIIYDPANRYLETLQAARAALIGLKTGFDLDVTAQELIVRSRWWKKLKQLQTYLAQNGYDEATSRRVFNFLDDVTPDTLRA